MPILRGSQGTYQPQKWEYIKGFALVGYKVNLSDAAEKF